MRPKLLLMTSAGNYLRYKYLDTYFRYFKTILYLASRYIFTARCTLVQSAVLWSHVVCLSVRLWCWWIVIT